MIPITPPNGTFAIYQDGQYWIVECNGERLVRDIPSPRIALLVMDALQRLDVSWSRFPEGFGDAEERKIQDALRELGKTLAPDPASSRHKPPERV